MLLFVLLLTAACRERVPVPDGDLLLHIAAGADEVLLGQSFPLTVVRVWDTSLVPGEWRDESLAPLTLRLEETTLREEDGRVEETRRYRAYAFAPGEIALEPVAFRAMPRGGGDERVVTSGPLALRVVPTVDPADPGAVEFPGEPLPAPAPWPLWTAGGGLALAAGLLLLRSRRRPRPQEPEPAPEAPPGPEVRVLACLGRLRAVEPTGEEALQAFYVEASGAVRGYAGERFAVRAAEMTTEQLLGAVQHARLGEVLRHCDLVKFARHAPTPAERARMLDGAESFVQETA